MPLNDLNYHILVFFPGLYRHISDASRLVSIEAIPWASTPVTVAKYGCLGWKNSSKMRWQSKCSVFILSVIKRIDCFRTHWWTGVRTNKQSHFFKNFIKLVKLMIWRMKVAIPFKKWYLAPKVQKDGNTNTRFCGQMPIFFTRNVCYFFMGLWYIGRRTL